MFVHVCRTGQSDIRTISVGHWGSELGLQVRSRLHWNLDGCFSNFAFTLNYIVVFYKFLALNRKQKKTLIYCLVNVAIALLGFTRTLKELQILTSEIDVCRDISFLKLCLPQVSFSCSSLSCAKLSQKNSFHRNINKMS
jgi:lipid-A-disaccharide synthase-like uncharacterized protein